MVDLALMSKLVAALPDHARLILLGDMDQLSSVEAGSVLGDICAGITQPETPLGQSIVKLQKSYRFDDQKGIGKLSRLINEGKAKQAWDFIHPTTNDQVKWNFLPLKKDLKSKIREALLPFYQSYFAADTIEAAFSKFKEFSILCGLRNGSYGAEQINQVIETILVEEEMIALEETWYKGRPIMITRNDYQLNLFNGDVGILFTDPEDGRRKAFFETTDPSEFRRITASRLPEHESVFAMTVHKSQGSEFKRVLLLLPDVESEVLTRELVYTGITRARENVEIWGVKKVFLQSIHKQCKRNSGLKEKLFSDRISR